MSTGIDQIIEGAAVDKRAKEAPRPVPQVSLLPGEIRGRARESRIRLVLVVAVGAAALLAAMIVLGASTLASAADQRVTQATGALASANAQLLKFKDVQVLEQRLSLGTAAVRVGSSPAIDWKHQLALLTADMPTGFVVQSLQADSSTSAGDYTQGNSPLELPRAATVQITAKTPSIEELPMWLRKLKALPDYADLSPTITSDETTYTVTVTVHLNTRAYITPLKEDVR